MNDPQPIDRLLTDFFRHERPDAWPAARIPVVTVPARAVDPNRLSRWTLAASAATLFGIGVCLSSGTPTLKPTAKGGDSLLTGSTANGERLLLPKQPMEPIPMP